ncbi:hypothetical protein DFH11DRAFT_1607465 [Phellopilus nigrolimitatus]|nr:hypothetical protein DFH11DRAFT_1607465 [Phellopilus nigrolimitatus]
MDLTLLQSAITQHHTLYLGYLPWILWLVTPAVASTAQLPEPIARAWQTPLPLFCFVAHSKTFFSSYENTA